MLTNNITMNQSRLVLSFLLPALQALLTLSTRRRTGEYPHRCVRGSTLPQLLLYVNTAAQTAYTSGVK